MLHCRCCIAAHTSPSKKGNGGAMRDRTADLLDANQALSQLSYGPVVWTCCSAAPTADKGISSEGKAEPDEVYNSTRRGFQHSHREEMVGLSRLELPTSPLSGVRSNQLSYRPVTVSLCTYRNAVPTEDFFSLPSTCRHALPTDNYLFHLSSQSICVSTYIRYASHR